MIWVQHWAQLTQEEWFRFSCKRHQTRSSAKNCIVMQFVTFSPNQQQVTE
jgi:hypothetical protein